MAGARLKDRLWKRGGWAAALLTVLFAHAGLLWAANHRVPVASNALGVASSAIMIDMPPLASAEEPVVEDKEEVAEPPPPEEAPPPKAEAVLPAPVQPPKKPEKPTPVKPRKDVKQAEKPTQQASSAAPQRGGGSVSPNAWSGVIYKHLSRHLVVPDEAKGNRGTAYVSFTVNRAGVVLSARLNRSSGNDALDRVAVALPKRASPLPAPPDELGGPTLTITLPVKFNG